METTTEGLGVQDLGRNTTAPKPGLEGGPPKFSYSACLVRQRVGPVLCSHGAVGKGIVFFFCAAEVAWHCNIVQ